MTAPATKPARRGPGRPSPIDRPYDTRPDGTTRLVWEAVADYVGEGCFVEEASALVGTDPNTIRGWLRTAARIRLQERDESPDLTQQETTCLRFFTAYTTAHAQWVHTNQLEMDTIGRGGRRITSIRERRKFTGPDDTVGFIAERITEVKTMPPDPQAIIWRMAMRNPGRYSPKFQIIEADGAALSDEETADATADSFEAFLAGYEQRKAEETPVETTP